MSRPIHHCRMPNPTWLWTLSDLYKSRSFSLCSIQNWSLFSHVLGTNIFLGTLQILKSTISPWSRTQHYKEKYMFCMSWSWVEVVVKWNLIIRSILLFHENEYGNNHMLIELSTITHHVGDTSQAMWVHLYK